jgi:hypothetical protein
LLPGYRNVEIINILSRNRVIHPTLPPTALSQNATLSSYNHAQPSTLLRACGRQRPCVKPGRSELGQKHRFDRQPLTSGVPRSTDILRVCPHVSKVPLSEVAALLRRRGRPDVQDGHDGSGGHHPRSCASYSPTDPFLSVAFSAYTRVIADVASSPVRGRRSKRAEARRSNADRAVNIMSGGGSARIGVPCEMPRGYMARASHSGSCEHGCGDQCSRQKFKLSHLISPLHEKPTASGSSFWLHDDQR